MNLTIADNWEMGAEPSLIEAGPWARLVCTQPGHPSVDVFDEKIVIGRNDNADVVVRDGAVSHSHCIISRELNSEKDADSTWKFGRPFEVYVEDCSKNGTFIKDVKIGKGGRVKIQSGTEVCLIPRGHQRKKLSYIVYIPIYEQQEEAPEGDVTFVFTDIQSSTSLWEEAPSEMNDALKKHDNILRRMIQKWKGYEVKTEGDAFMVAFFSVIDAVCWCLEVQLALLNASWSDSLLKHRAAGLEVDKNNSKIFAGIRVRMGIHTGIPNCRRNPVTGRMDYFGTVVNRAARISDSAHGGQVVMSDEVKAVVDKTLESKKLSISINKVDIQDLGWHTYKGISEEVHVYQISCDILGARAFPTLRTPESKGKEKAERGHKLLPEENPNLMSAVSPQNSSAPENSSSADPHHQRDATLGIAPES